jgi:hypothetical protein
MHGTRSFINFNPRRQFQLLTDDQYNQQQLTAMNLTHIISPQEQTAPPQPTADTTIPTIDVPFLLLKTLTSLVQPDTIGTFYAQDQQSQQIIQLPKHVHFRPKQEDNPQR